MKKGALSSLLLISVSALFLVTSCSNKSEGGLDFPRTHPDQNLSDKAVAFKLGDKTFDLSLDFEEAKKLFGEEMTVWWSKDIVDEINEEHDDIDEKYDDWIYTYIVQDGVYSADLNFKYNEKDDKFELHTFQTVYDFEDKEKFDVMHNVYYTENGKKQKKDFPYETDKIVFSIDGLAMGTATNEQLAGHFGKGSIDMDEDGIHIRRQVCVYEDYTIVTYYNNDGVFRGIFLFPTPEDKR